MERKVVVMEGRSDKEYRKEINGKTFYFVLRQPEMNILKMKCIALWPPDGTTISIKPYSISPDKILDKLNGCGFKNYDIDKVKDPSFCLATLNVNNNSEIIKEALEKIYKVKNGGTLSLARQYKKQGKVFSQPSCPYGRTK